MQPDVMFEAISGGERRLRTEDFYEKNFFLNYCCPLKFFIQNRLHTTFATLHQLTADSFEASLATSLHRFLRT